MADAEKEPPWWKELLRKEAVGGHVVNAVVNLAVTFVAGLVGTVCWIAWAAWRGSFLWTQRGIGAAMTFAVVIVATAVALHILRRRLTVPSAGRPVAPKGYLDHIVESDKAHKEFVRIMTLLTKITNDNTKRTIASTERIKKINRLPFSRQVRAKLAESRRSALSYDKTTKRLNAQIPPIERAVRTIAPGNLAYWKWYTANHRITAGEAQGLIQGTRTRLSSNESWLQSQANHRTQIEALRGTSQVLDEAIDRHLAVMDRLREVMATEREPLKELILLLEQHAPS
jgi:hypothetical protein